MNHTVKNYEEGELTEEGFSGDSHTGTYIAGIWFPDKTRVGWWKNGYRGFVS